MKSRMFKQLFSVLLAVCLTAGTLSVPVRAEEASDEASELPSISAPECPDPLETPETPRTSGFPELSSAPPAPEQEAAEGPEEPVYEVHKGAGSVEDSLPFSQLPDSAGLEAGASYTGRYYDQLDSASKSVYSAICGSPLMDGPTTEKVPLDVAYSDPQNKSAPILAALGALLYDHPELSWLVNTEFSYGYYESTHRLISYSMSANGYKNATTDPGQTVTSATSIMADTKDRAAIEAAIDRARAEIGSLDGLCEFDRVQALHDWVCNHMDYTDQTGSKFLYGWRGFQTAYSALVEQETVCAGYAKSFKLLCDEYGIPCAIVVGLGNGGPHAWNYVELDGAWYAVDCTWADQDGYISYKYFLKGSGDFERHEEGTLYGEYAFAYPELSRNGYTDPAAPASIALSYTPEAETASQNGIRGFAIPAVNAPGQQAAKEVLLTAVPQDAGGTELTHKTVQWSISRELEGVTLTPDGNSAILTFTSSSLPAYSGNGPVVTITAFCGGVSAEQTLWLYVPERTPSFLRILKDGTAVSSDWIRPGESVSYTAAVYDQYGMELAGQTVAWEASGGAQAVPFGSAGVILTPTVDGGAAALTAQADSLREELSIFITDGAHTHIWAENWSRDEDFHWHACTAPGCYIVSPGGMDGYAPHSYEGEYQSDAGGHWQACACGVPGGSVPHDWDGGRVTKKPTFESAGVRTFTCTACGRTRSQSIPRLIHAYSAAWSADETGHWHACADPGYEHLTKDRADHVWDGGRVTKEPAFESAGVRTFTCAVCQYAREEEILRLEHAYSAAWSADETGHWHACADPGYEHLTRDRADHVWNGGLNAPCGVCGYVQAAPAVTVSASGAYRTANAPKGARLFLVRYGEGRRFLSVEELEALSGTLSGSGRLLLLDASLRPLCPPGELTG